MKIQIKLRHNRDEYFSNVNEVTIDELKIIEELLERASSGKLTHFVLEGKDESYYFSKQIISESVITIIKGDSKPRVSPYA